MGIKDLMGNYDPKKKPNAKKSSSKYLLVEMLEKNDKTGTHIKVDISDLDPGEAIACITAAMHSFCANAGIDIETMQQIVQKSLDINKDAKGGWDNK